MGTFPSTEGHWIIYWPPFNLSIQLQDQDPTGLTRVTRPDILDTFENGQNTQTCSEHPHFDPPCRTSTKPSSQLPFYCQTSSSLENDERSHSMQSIKEVFFTWGVSQIFDSIRYFLWNDGFSQQIRRNPQKTEQCKCSGQDASIHTEVRPEWETHQSKVGQLWFVTPGRSANVASTQRLGCRLWKSQEVQSFKIS